MTIFSLDEINTFLFMLLIAFSASLPLLLMWIRKHKKDKNFA